MQFPLSKGNTVKGISLTFLFCQNWSFRLTHANIIAVIQTHISCKLIASVPAWNKFDWICETNTDKKKNNKGSWLCSHKLASPIPFNSVKKAKFSWRFKKGKSSGFITEICRRPKTSRKVWSLRDSYLYFPLYIM